MYTVWLPNVPNLFNIDFHKPPVRSITILLWRAHDAQTWICLKMFCFFQSTFYTKTILFCIKLINGHTFSSFTLAYGCHIKISLRIFVRIFGYRWCLWLRVQLFTLYDNHTIFIQLSWSDREKIRMETVWISSDNIGYFRADTAMFDYRAKPARIELATYPSARIFSTHWAMRIGY